MGDEEVEDVAQESHGTRSAPRRLLERLEKRAVVIGSSAHVAVGKNRVHRR
jgi:hypothetical protein